MKTNLRLLFLPLFLCHGISIGFAEQAQQSASRAQVPDGLATSDWHSIRAAYEAGRHAFHAVDGGWQARNPGQQWTTKFDGRGFLARPRTGNWQWGLELLSYGFEGHQTVIRGKAQVEIQGQRLSYRWTPAVEEWFVNDQRGLEHGFTIAERPAGVFESDLGFLLGARGSLRPTLAHNAQGVIFKDATGTAVLDYTGLKVWDADGKVLASRFEAAGENQVRLLVEESGARYPLTIDPIAQQAYLKASNTGDNDQFGYSVAVSGDTVVVGAYNEDSNTTGVNSTPNNSASDSGAAYVFVRSGTNWVQQAYLKASNTGAGDWFGRSVAVSGDTVVVGAYNEDSNTTGVDSTPNNSASDSGAAYVFVRSGTNWVQQAYLKASNTGANDRFGQSVAVSGDTVIVGANGEASSTTGVNSTPNNNASFSGAAYVFFRSGVSWNQQAYLKAASTSEFDNFGWAVSISGDTVLVGVPSENSTTSGVNSTPNMNGDNSGAAYVFVRSGTDWTQQAYLKASNTGDRDQFGYSVAVSGDTVIVGAQWEDSSSTGVDSTPDDNAPDSGAAYVFVRSGSSWNQQAYLKASNAETGDQFGWAVSMSGDIAVVGANMEDSRTTGVNSIPDESAAGSGAAYVFVRNNVSWSQHAYLKASNSDSDDQFGVSVAASGDTLVIGAPNEDSNTIGVDSTPNNSTTNSGAAYTFFGLGSTTTSPAVASVSPSSGSTAGGTSVTITGTNFTGATGVTFGGAAATNVSVVNATTITCTTPARSAGSASVLVTTPDGTNAANSLFTYVGPAPTVTNVNPSTGSTAGGTSVTITGTNFTGATGVSFGGTSATNVSVVNATTISCTTPAGSAGSASVLVTTPGGTNAANSLFTYGTPPTVTVTNVSPSSGTTAGGTSVTITGTNFTGATGVSFGGTSATNISVVNATTITCTTPARSAGSASVLVTTPGGTNAANSLFTYVTPVPTVTSVNPSTGSTAGGTSVTITGTNFTGATGVSFGGTSATNVSVVNATTITCTTPAGSAGSASVLVTTPGGTNAANSLFTYGTPPTVTVTNVSPSSGTTAGGTSVTITGTNFTGATSVTFGGAAATNISVVNATTITCTTPARSAGVASVLVTTPGGTNLANSLFTYVTPSPEMALEAYLKAGNTGANDLFGHAVAISGDTAVIGAVFEDSNATGVGGNGANNSLTDSGAVYVYVRSAGVWSQQAYLKASNPGVSDYFGSSVAVSGDTLVIGALQEDSNATGVGGDGTNNSASSAGAAYVFTRTSGVWTQQAYLKASHSGGGKYFGGSVAVSGDTVVVGAHGESSSATGVNGNQSDTSISFSGAAYVFTRSAGMWSQQAYLKASNPGEVDQFGYRVAVSGDTVVIGALSEDSNADGINGNQSDNNANDAGAAYVFVRSGSTWSQQAYLKASNSWPDNYFGGSVAVDGDTVLISAEGEASSATGVNGNQFDASASIAGAAYVFTRSAGLWSQQAYLKASNTGESDQFGVGLALSGDIAVIGAYREGSNATGINGNQANNSASNAGAAYVFARSGSTWSQRAYLKASNTGPNDNFGTSVAVSGDTAVIGTPQEDSNATGINGDGANNIATNSGAAYIFYLGAPSGYTGLANALAAAGLSEDDALPGATPFGDGVENLLKYAFNMNLAGPDVSGLSPGTGSSGLPSIVTAGTGASGVLCVEFVRRVGSGLVYTPKKSATLAAGSFLPLSDTPTVDPIGTDGLWERVIYDEPVNLDTIPGCFGMVEVTLP